MPGGIEEQIFQNIEAGSGETFDEGDSYEPSQNEPTTREDTRRQRETDEELDNADRQLRSRGRREDIEEDTNRQKLPPDQRLKPGQKREDADRQKATDEYGNPIGSNSYHVTRRLKSQLDNQRSVNQTLKGQVEDLTRRLAETQVLNDLPKQLGLSNQDTAELLQLSAVLKANPTEGARKVIEIALAKGANLKDIVNDEFIPSLTLNATQRLIDERLGPLARERQEKAGVDTETAEATAEARQFLADYPEAEIHGDVLADQMKKIRQEYDARGLKVAPYIVAEKAFQRIEQFCRDNKFDINQPLAPQIEARTKGNGRSPSGDRQPPSRQTPRPMPSGSDGGGEPVSRRKQVADADDSYSSIVREALLESGYQL